MILIAVVLSSLPALLTRFVAPLRIPKQPRLARPRSNLRPRRHCEYRLQPNPSVTTEPAAIAEPVDATVTAIESGAPERLPSCGAEQLRLAFTVSEGSAAVVLRRMKGQPCHHGRAPIGFTVRDQSGDDVAVFGGNRGATRPADFSNGFAQLLEIPRMSCNREGSFLVVATVGPYVVRRTLPGTELPCNHG